MSTLFVAAILVGVIAAICLLLVSIDKKQKRNAMNELLRAFHQKGAEYKLSFSSQEILKDTILGLDGMHRKLLVLERAIDKTFSSCVIDLNGVQTCSVKKEYGTINSGELNVKNPEQYLKTISLHFVLYNKPAVEIVFYNFIREHVHEIAERENKAKHWETILSKLLVPVKKIA